MMSSESTSRFNGYFVLGTFVVGFFIVVGLALLLAGQFDQIKLSGVPEAQTGVLIVLAVSIMTLLLFIVTAGFHALGLSAKDQPLGLPPGSVRAFIALILIMIFVILSVYAVRVVGEGYFYSLGTMSREEALQFANVEGFVVRSVGDGQFQVAQVRAIDDGGGRLAQQLVTTVATLVVAVAGFYFGATNVQAALEQHNRGASAVPLIRDIDSDSGNRGETVSATLTGRNLSAPKSVRLVRDKEAIEATDILFNDTTIQCNFKLPDDVKYSGTWDVVVENIDGEEDRLEGAFTINQ